MADQAAPGKLALAWSERERCPAAVAENRGQSRRRRVSAGGLLDRSGAGNPVDHDNDIDNSPVDNVNGVITAPVTG